MKVLKTWFQRAKNQPGSDGGGPPNSKQVPICKLEPSVPPSRDQNCPFENCSSIDVLLSPKTLSERKLVPCTGLEISFIFVFPPGPYEVGESDVMVLLRYTVCDKVW